MALTFGTSIPHSPNNVASLSTKIWEFKFTFNRLAASLQKVAFTNEGSSHAKLYFSQVKLPATFGIHRRMDWSIKNNADGRGLDPFTNSSDGRTRLIKTIQTLQIRQNARIQDLRKDLLRKFLCFLVGFYCATAFATVIGQTGDWDILSAALAAAVVEGIGALMYKASVPLLDRIRNLVVLFNYWKAGLVLGLFLDSFKY